MSNIKLENLEINDYMIYQDKDSFNFGIDAVLLANFALREYGSKKSDATINICDFCTGTLPIPLIMYAKRKLFLGNNMKITAFEIDKDQVSICNKSIKYNKENVSDAINIDSDIKVICDDIKNIDKEKDKYKTIYESFDMITCNPPYIKSGSGIKNLNDKKIIARHEVFITFEEICKVAQKILKSNKKFYLVHHSERFAEIACVLKSYSFEIKKVQFIYPRVDKRSTLCLIEAVKNAKSSLKVLEPIIVFDRDGSYTKNIENIYGK
ncbi:MAG: SAM-dependent methyltransferase [Lachnospiraceae bacterium]|nr:SAM-dependent methyltransferase [Lachnospiraceae bacterium]